MDLCLRGPEHDGQERDVGNVAEAGQLLQGFPGLDGQAAQLGHHEVHDVLGVPLGMDALEVPRPARMHMIEGEQPLVGERRNELHDEKRIATRLLMDQLRQRGGARWLAAQGLRHELPHVITGEGRQADHLHRRSRLTDRVEFAPERMGRINFVVPVGPDQHQMPHIRLSQHVCDEIQGGRVEPLQVVEKERQRMLRPGKHAEEAPEHKLKPASRVL